MQKLQKAILKTDYSCALSPGNVYAEKFLKAAPLAFRTLCSGYPLDSGGAVS